MHVPNMHGKKHQSGRKHRRDHQAGVNIVGSSSSSSLEGKNAGQKHHRGRQHRRDHRRHSPSSLVVNKVAHTHTHTHTHTSGSSSSFGVIIGGKQGKKGGRKKRSSWYHSIRHPRFRSRILTIVIIIINIKYTHHRNHKQHRVHRIHRRHRVGVGLNRTELGSISKFFARDALDVASALPKAPQASKVSGRGGCRRSWLPSHHRVDRLLVPIFIRPSAAPST
jgi:hypothetical protein